MYIREIFASEIHNRGLWNLEFSSRNPESSSWNPESTACNQESKNPTIFLEQWRIQGRGPGGPAPPLFLDQTEARWAEKIGGGDRHPPPPYLRVWT